MDRGDRGSSSLTRTLPNTNDDEGRKPTAFGSTSNTAGYVGGVARESSGPSTDLPAAATHATRERASMSSLPPKLDSNTQKVGQT